MGVGVLRRGVPGCRRSNLLQERNNVSGATTQIRGANSEPPPIGERVSINRAKRLALAIDELLGVGEIWLRIGCEKVVHFTQF